MTGNQMETFPFLYSHFNTQPLINNSMRSIPRGQISHNSLKRNKETNIKQMKHHKSLIKKKHNAHNFLLIFFFCAHINCLKCLCSRQ